MSNILVFHRENEAKSNDHKKNVRFLVVRNPAVSLEKSARNLIKKIKTRFHTSFLLFLRCLLLIYEAILAVPLAHQHAGLAGDVEIPMEYFSRAVEAVLLDGLLHDAVDFTLTEKHWNLVVQHCGYVASEQAVERNARGLGH